MVATLCFISCKKDDNPSVKPQIGGPPLSFNLLEVPLNATEVGLAPTLSWESAKNPDAGEVSYDLYLGTEPNPTVLFKGGINETSFDVQDQLHLSTDYYWKVIATDIDGKTSQSPIYKFNTRTLNIPAEPLNPSADFSKRFSHTSAVLNNKIWVIGGFTPEGRNNEVWSSTNGVAWELVADSAGFVERSNHSSVVFDGKLWVIAGRTGASEYSNDVWYSENGKDWELATASAGFTGRYRHSTVVFDNKLWVIGGFNQEDLLQKDVWYSTDGIDWNQTPVSDNFPKRYLHSSVVFDNKLWIMGGTSGFGSSSVREDVWALD